MATTEVTMITMNTVERNTLGIPTLIPWILKRTMITMTTLDVYTSTMNTMDTSKRQPSRVRAHNCWGLELATSGLQGP